MQEATLTNMSSKELDEDAHAVMKRQEWMPTGVKHFFPIRKEVQIRSTCKGSRCDAQTAEFVRIVSARPVMHGQWHLDHIIV